MIYERKFTDKGGIFVFQIKRVDMITKTFRLPKDMLKELEILAQKNNISVNKLVIQCCRYALDNREPEEEKIPSDSCCSDNQPSSSRSPKE